MYDLTSVCLNILADKKGNMNSLIRAAVRLKCGIVTKVLSTQEGLNNQPVTEPRRL
jgi:hypothetical protein